MTLKVTYKELGKHGRLGNQLFEIAATVGLAKTHGTLPAFPEDWEYREFFSLPDEWYDDDAVGAEAHSIVDLPFPANTYLQDISLWANAQEEVFDALGPSVEATKTLFPILKETLDVLRGPVLALHVRRGDNLTNNPGTINCLPKSYYIEAANIKKADATSVVVFSDDIEWCKNELTDELAVMFTSVSFFNGTPRPPECDPSYPDSPVMDWIDMQVMAYCDHFILSNSSYSWWAAFLSGQNNPPVYPSYWYGEVLHLAGHDPSLIFPEGWQKIEVVDPNPVPEPEPEPIPEPEPTEEEILDADPS